MNHSVLAPGGGNEAQTFTTEMCMREMTNKNKTKTPFGKAERNNMKRCRFLQQTTVNQNTAMS